MVGMRDVAKEAGVSLLALCDIRAGLSIERLPRHTVEFAEIPGRPGKRMTQGPTYPLQAPH